MKKLTEQQIKTVTEFLQEGRPLPEEYKDLFFPTKKEYELIYTGKEREEDIIVETMVAPLQPVKTFGNPKPDEWTNKLIFGDNLQVLKYLYEEQQAGRLEKIRLIYIDPPFATKQEFRGTQEQKAYQDKLAGANFLEFLRKRLVILQRMLADNGNIFIHLDYRKMHYIKILLDEVFGEQNFRNEIIWRRTFAGKTISRNIPQNADLILWYSKTDRYTFKPVSTELTDKDIAQFNKDDNDGRGKYATVSLQKVAGPTPGTNYDYTDNRGRVWKCPAKGWRMTIDKLKALENDNRLYLTDRTIRQKYYLDERLKKGKQIDNIWTDIGNLNRNPSEIVNFPTQKPESLLERIITACSPSLKNSDIVFDAFAGSGTTGAVSEKLGRRWIMIDSSKLALYTMQKRLLNLKAEIGNRGKSLAPKPFTVYYAGLYDYKLIKNLLWEEYRQFALKLFQCRDEKHTVSGIKLDGYLGVDHVLVFRWKDKEEYVMDRGYIDDLHKSFGEKIGKQIFIIAPTASVVFFEDYIEKDGVKYFILRIPDSIIEEISEKGFERLKQPIKEADINDIVDSVGFDFIIPPKVKCEYKISEKGKGQMMVGESSKQAVIKIKSFRSKVIGETTQKMKDLETLSMVMVDYNYDGKVFDIDDYWFAEEVAKNNYEVRFDPQKVSKQMMIIYMDIFGNEKREIKKLKEFK